MVARECAKLAKQSTNHHQISIPIPWLENMLTRVNAFGRLILSGYHQIRFRVRDEWKITLKYWMSFVNGWSCPFVLPMYIAHLLFNYLSFTWMMLWYIVRLSKNILFTFNNWWEFCVKRSPASIWRKCIFCWYVVSSHGDEADPENVSFH